LSTLENVIKHFLTSLLLKKILKCARFIYFNTFERRVISEHFEKSSTPFTCVLEGPGNAIELCLIGRESAVKLSATASCSTLLQWREVHHI